MLAILPKMNLKYCSDRSGSVSNRNSKMPGTTFAISPSACKVGSKLAAIKGSTCSRCYAIKLEKIRACVRIGWSNNLAKASHMIQIDPAQWSRDMAFMILHHAHKSGVYFHRWFDAGDIQSPEMLHAITLVCDLTPNVKHWLPTRESKLVYDYVTARQEPMPPNLVIRISSTMIGDKPLSRGRNTSTVHHKGQAPFGYACPARHQGNACGDCRACWSPAVANVSYPLH